jgi:hypothetical protein
VPFPARPPHLAIAPCVVQLHVQVTRGAVRFPDGDQQFVIVRKALLLHAAFEAAQVVQDGMDAIRKGGNLLAGKVGRAHGAIVHMRSRRGQPLCGRVTTGVAFLAIGPRPVYAVSCPGPLTAQLTHRER